MGTPRPRRGLSGPYRVPSFPPLQTVVGVFGDPNRRIVRLVRRSKKWPVECGGGFTVVATITRGGGSAPPRAGVLGFLGETGAGGVPCRRCGAVKRERLDFLADNPRYTKRFAFYVGKRCRSSTIKDIAEELGVEWHTVK